jgi:hypothetical protein
MLPFAHIGITLVLFWILGVGLRGVRAHVRYGYVVVGAMLPDIIDKPVGMIFFADTFGSGRIFGHTLLFVLLLAVAGYYLFSKKGDAGVLILAGGSLVHQLLDSMWNSPASFLWPLLGWEFERRASYGSFWQFLGGVYGRLGDIADPQILSLVMTEIFGLVVMALFGLAWVRGRIKRIKRRKGMEEMEGRQ